MEKKGACSLCHRNQWKAACGPKDNFHYMASSGLGKATAKLFQNKHGNVMATMHNPVPEIEFLAAVT
jgi:hypothetical protein